MRKNSEVINWYTAYSTEIPKEAIGGSGDDGDASEMQSEGKWVS